LRKVRREMKKARWEKEEEENVERLVADLPKRPKRALERVRKENMSGWLTVGPSKQYGFGQELGMGKSCGTHQPTSVP